MAKNFNKNLKRANWFLGTFIDEVQFWYICYFGFTVHVCNDEWSTWCLACVVDVIQPWLVSSEKERNTLVLGAKRTQRITRNAFRISVQPDWPIRPIYSYGWKQGWRWPCSDTNLRALLCKSSYSYANEYFSRTISITKQRRFVSKQGHRQPPIHSKVRVLSPQL